MGSLAAALAEYQAAAAANDPDIRAQALTRIADLHRERCEWDEAEEAARLAQNVARDAGLTDRLTEATIAEANTLMARGKFASAMPRFQEIADASADARVRGIALQNIGSMLAQLARFSEAERAFQESLSNFAEAGYARGEAIARNNLGRLALDQKNFAIARPLLERAAQEAAAVGHSELAAVARENLATVLCETGEPNLALELVLDALAYFSACSNRLRQIECLRIIGAINETNGDPTGARRCYERALVLADEIGSDIEKRVTRHRLDALSARVSSSS